MWTIDETLTYVKYVVSDRMVSTRSCSGISTSTVSAKRALGVGLAVLLVACDGEAQPPATPALEPLTQVPEQGPANVPDSQVADTDPRPFQDLAAADILNLNQRWTGDYDELAERRFLRVLVPFSRTLYYLDGPEQKGIAYESLRELGRLRRQHL